MSTPGFRPRWPFRSKRITEPGAAMFAKLRTHLTLWYTAILGGTILLFGLALYFGTQQMLFAPVQAQLARQARQLQQAWQVAGTCPLDASFPSTAALQIERSAPEKRTRTADNTFSDTFVQVVYNSSFVCATADGKPAQAIGHVQPQVQGIISIRQTARQGQPIQIVEESGQGGQWAWYSVPVYTAQTYSSAGQLLGVAQVGESVKVQNDALQILLLLLCSVGVLALGVASLGGQFLANRSLAPARLAFQRQRDFIANASHELRTPLALLRADAEVLLRKREQLRQDDVELLEDIVAEASHMSKLATNMLTLARLDAGKIHMEHDIINLADLAEEVVERSEALARQKDLTLTLENQGAALVLGDRTMLEQMMLILLDNAIKYNEHGGKVSIRTFIAQERANFEVHDTGIGIAPEHIPHLGERFYCVDQARTHETSGSGLGLSIAKDIVSAHEGKLSFTSALKQGTTATFSMPAVDITA
ncbi:hypothetical protein EPA93_47060 [Ktedonosporobacter rubrisoli]|uniref:histidine kinase n=1 Tax=Ktedonosporobacter rubrisoli TaxID=2509675 RepID=A0A4P6K4K1_KTERU|nr:ATP-binding protein [Ktedonosporobacter rubrisoli]QBD83124.1 hypothetical protein EPA93_47060 [Ktedonosporobacter rubrisoli]